jgi:MFS family permease
LTVLRSTPDDVSVQRNAALFVAISLVTGFGSAAMSLVAGVWILDLTGSSSLAGLAGFCVYAPTLGGPWLGALVDRVPRRALVITVDLVLAAVLLSLLAVRSGEQAWLIYAVMLAYGISYVLLGAGESALLPAALPAAALGDVNGWRSSAQEGMKLIAPLAGAALYGWHGGPAATVAAAAMPVLAAGLYTLVRLDRDAAAPARRRTQSAAGQSGRPTRRPAAEPVAPLSGVEPVAPRSGLEPVSPLSGVEPVAPRSGVEPVSPLPGVEPAASGAGVEPVASRAEGFRAGMSVLWANRAIRVPVAVAGVSIAMSGFGTSAVYATVTDRLGLPATAMGILASAQGAGSIAGGLGVGRLLAGVGPVRVAACGAALFAAGRVLQCLPGWPPVVAGTVLIGIGLPWTLIAGVTAVQTNTPDALLGRVSATSGTAMFGPNALAIPLGAAAVHLGDRPPLLATAAACVTAAALAGFHRRVESPARQRDTVAGR